MEKVASLSWILQIFLPREREREMWKVRENYYLTNVPGEKKSKAIIVIGDFPLSSLLPVDKNFRVLHFPSLCRYGVHAKKPSYLCKKSLPWVSDKIITSHYFLLFLKVVKAFLNLLEVASVFNQMTRKLQRRIATTQPLLPILAKGWVTPFAVLCTKENLIRNLMHKRKPHTD